MPESVRGSASTIRISVGQLVAGQAAPPACVDEVVGADGAGVRAQLDRGHRHGARGDGRPGATTAAPRTAGCALERGADVVGPDLEPAPDDGLVGPAEDPEEPVAVDAGEVGGADPAVVAELVGLAPRAGPRRRRRAPRPSRGRPPAARSRGGPGRRSPAWSPRTLGGPRGSSPPRRRRTRWRRRTISTGTPYRSVKASASSGSSGAVPRHHRSQARRGRRDRGRPRGPCAARSGTRLDGAPAGGGARRRPSRRRVNRSSSAERPAVVDATAARGTARRGAPAAS